MVLNRVWHDAGLHPDVHCCLSCLERRLNRLLTIRDFPACPVNRQAYAAHGLLSLVDRKQRKRTTYAERDRRRWQIEHAWDGQYRLFLFSAAGRETDENVQTEKEAHESAGEDEAQAGAIKAGRRRVGAVSQRADVQN